MSDFVAMQKRCREIEGRLRRIHRLERRLTKEWECLKQQMAQEIYHSRYGSNPIGSYYEDDRFSTPWHERDLK